MIEGQVKQEFVLLSAPYSRSKTFALFFKYKKDFQHLENGESSSLMGTEPVWVEVEGSSNRERVRS